MLNYLQYKKGKLRQNFLDDTVHPDLDRAGIGQSEKQSTADKLAAFCQEEVMVYGDLVDGKFTVFAVMFNDLLLGTKETKAVADYLKFKFEDTGDTYKINEIEKMKLENLDAKK